MTLLDLGIDIGGTKIAMGLSKKQGVGLTRKLVFSSQGKLPPTQWYARLKENMWLVLGHDLKTFQDKGRIGVAIPGQILKDGRIGHCPNTPVLKKLNLAQWLKKDFKVPVHTDNDANAAALAEHQFGAGRGIQRMVYLTISTGIGGGIIEGGKLVTGNDHVAGEVGHLIIHFDGERCACGRRGCLEAYGRGPALEERIRRRLSQKKLSVGEKQLLNLAGGKASHWRNTLISRALKKHNPVILQELDRHSFYLAVGIGSLANILNPERIVLGGGLTQLGKPLFAAIHKHLKSVAIPKHVDLRPAALGADVGIYGAIALCRK